MVKGENRIDLLEINTQVSKKLQREFNSYSNKLSQSLALALKSVLNMYHPYSGKDYLKEVELDLGEISIDDSISTLQRKLIWALRSQGWEKNRGTVVAADDVSSKPNKMSPLFSGSDVGEKMRVAGDQSSLLISRLTAVSEPNDITGVTLHSDFLNNSGKFDESNTSKSEDHVIVNQRFYKNGNQSGEEYLCAALPNSQQNSGIKASFVAILRHYYSDAYIKNLSKRQINQAFNDFEGKFGEKGDFHGVIDKDYLDSLITTYKNSLRIDDQEGLFSAGKILDYVDQYVQTRPVRQLRAWVNKEVDSSSQQKKWEFLFDLILLAPNCKLDCVDEEVLSLLYKKYGGINEISKNSVHELKKELLILGSRVRENTREEFNCVLQEESEDYVKKYPEENRKRKLEQFLKEFICHWLRKHKCCVHSLIRTERKWPAKLTWKILDSVNAEKGIIAKVDSDKNTIVKSILRFKELKELIESVFLFYVKPVDVEKERSLSTDSCLSIIYKNLTEDDYYQILLTTIVAGSQPALSQICECVSRNIESLVSEALKSNGTLSNNTGDKEQTETPQNDRVRENEIANSTNITQKLLKRVSSPFFLSNESLQTPVAEMGEANSVAELGLETQQLLLTRFISQLGLYYSENISNQAGLNRAKENLAERAVDAFDGKSRGAQYKKTGNAFKSLLDTNLNTVFNHYLKQHKNLAVSCTDEEIECFLQQSKKTGATNIEWKVEKAKNTNVTPKKISAQVFKDNISLLKSIFSKAFQGNDSWCTQLEDLFFLLHTMLNEEKKHEFVLFFDSIQHRKVTETILNDDLISEVNDSHLVEVFQTLVLLNPRAALLQLYLIVENNLANKPILEAKSEQRVDDSVDKKVSKDISLILSFIKMNMEHVMQLFNDQTAWPGSLAELVESTTGFGLNHAHLEPLECLPGKFASTVQQEESKGPQYESPKQLTSDQLYSMIRNSLLLKDSQAGRGFAIFKECADYIQTTPSVTVIPHDTGYRGSCLPFLHESENKSLQTNKKHDSVQLSEAYKKAYKSRKNEGPGEIINVLDKKRERVERGIAKNKCLQEKGLSESDQMVLQCIKESASVIGKYFSLGKWLDKLSAKVKDETGKEIPVFAAEAIQALSEKVQKAFYESELTEFEETKAAFSLISGEMWRRIIDTTLNQSVSRGFLQCCLFLARSGAQRGGPAIELAMIYLSFDDDEFTDPASLHGKCALEGSNVQEKPSVMVQKDCFKTEHQWQHRTLSWLDENADIAIETMVSHAHWADLLIEKLNEDIRCEEMAQDKNHHIAVNNAKEIRKRWRTLQIHLEENGLRECWISQRKNALHGKDLKETNLAIAHSSIPLDAHFWNLILRASVKYSVSSAVGLLNAAMKIETNHLTDKKNAGSMLNQETKEKWVNENVKKLTQCLLSSGSNVEFLKKLDNPGSQEAFEELVILLDKFFLLIQKAYSVENMDNSYWESEIWKSVIKSAIHMGAGFGYATFCRSLEKRIKSERSYQYKIERPSTRVQANDGGIVLLHPFILPLLKNCGYDFEENPDEFRLKALSFLHYIVWGENLNLDSEGFQMADITISLLLSGFEEEKYNLLSPGVLSDSDIEQVEALLSSIKQHWPVLSRFNRSHAFQQMFLQRPATVELEGSVWKVTEEPKAHDIMLKSCPWGYTGFKLPWLQNHIEVEWSVG